MFLPFSLGAQDWWACAPEGRKMRTLCMNMIPISSQFSRGEGIWETFARGEHI